MTAVSRTAQFAKVHKVLKKNYKLSPTSAGRTVMEHLLFACCLEDAPRDVAEEAFAALVHTFFDWNEVRVTSLSELSEVMACLPDPRAAANRIKRVLHAVFEGTFNFDLDELRKKNLGPTVQWLEKLDGMTHFTTAYAVQAGLGGHSIPIDAGTMAAFHVLDLVTDQDAETGVVPGMERAVAKSKGVEFGALVHELDARFSANPYSSAIREVLLQINPECRGRLPKRRSGRAAPKSESASSTSTAKPSKSEKAAKPRATASESRPSKKKSSSTAPSKAAAPKKRTASERLSKRKPR